MADKMAATNSDQASCVRKEQEAQYALADARMFRIGRS
jgi:hypothetical protein